jgi:hypothetical protein
MTPFEKILALAIVAIAGILIWTFFLVIKTQAIPTSTVAALHNKIYEDGTPDVGLPKYDDYRLPQLHLWSGLYARYATISGELYLSTKRPDHWSPDIHKTVKDVHAHVYNCIHEKEKFPQGIAYCVVMLGDEGPYDPKKIKNMTLGYIPIRGSQIRFDDGQDIWPSMSDCYIDHTAVDFRHCK